MTRSSSNRFEYRTRISFVWNYEKDESWLTGLSAQGLHLNKPGLIRSRFEKDTSVRYVYRMDYQKISGKESLNEYMTLFEDSGWEHVGSLVGWHYFRKRYDEGESYDIYTDRGSVKQLLRRVQLTLGIIGLANVLPLILNINNLRSEARSSLIESTFTFVVVLEIVIILLLSYGCLRFEQKIKKLDE
ncbi:DUF2812 domain-containing protein [Paenibacillus aceris]|uniref:DUF2812 domain-containing protein n=1 Tax=Paenibacillus aceris TaxID=869555 RepID=A0ABS4I137_9BACL|nr:DUF2812 domain-containing protein [Paenibacillus aceris]MBP1964508.1 hypothetical protein [Paenibacillus aceris]NHW35782.1 DUF2812 domain-containing protein [Paenibacillus aceris]